MGTQLYVGGLPYRTSDDELRAHFEQAGGVTSVKIVMDRMTGRSRGFGFVEMATPEDAQKAIEMFHGKDFGGRNLIVNEARPMEERPPRRDGGRGGFGGGGRGGDRGGYQGGGSEGGGDNF